MKTFGELVTQIKRGLLELCSDLLGPGAAQALGPAHAYGKSFLIFQSVRTLQEAIQMQENHLKNLVGKENSYGAVQNNDTKLWRVVDSIFQSLSLIDRYVQDPSRFTHQGIAEWFKQEAANCGLSSTFLTDELDIAGKGFTLELQLTDQESVSAAHIIFGTERVRVDEIVEMLQNDNKTHVSHLLSMAARLDVIESEGQSLMNITAGIYDRFHFKRSLGGLRFPFTEGFEAVLTLDSYDQNRMIPMIVIDPPIVFPVNQLKEISSLSSVRFNVDLSVSSFISAMLNLSKDVVREYDGKSVRLLLNDENLPSIMLARLPLTRFDSFEKVVDNLKTAATWCSVIKDAFSTKSEVASTVSIDVAPNEDFTLAITYWVQDYPARLVVRVNPDGTLFTDNDDLNNALGGPTTSFPSIISHLIQQ
ncbi:hypothetical protein TRFO_16461 [Tritrichomonas foetus]|uniref:Mediator of RNA polymerase II transcription subunit 1 n=1 Tax=Tritrichomonas foetus TaxID=1144522 RepID=A0A1J4KQ53_9EUKA|nr:hypothetical protein TRFO_16461 [Tritrichomonas foetus]|eukprot:OHT13371.1 hypothetical protein TRFO_16461 [Tritrichomonas foetus]